MTVHLDVGDLARRYDLLGRMPQRWTNPQRALFNSPFRVTVFRGGNGMGKSLALAKLVEDGIAGELPWQRGRRGPFVVVLAGKTWSQLGSTIHYLMQGRMKGWLKEGIRYEGGAMKGQRMAVYDIVAGPGKGGQLRLGIFNAETLAGPRADMVVSDEPLPEAVYNELWPRLNGRQGRLYMGFTTTMGTAGKLDYLWRLVDDPEKPWIGELAFELTLENVTPRGGLVEVPFMTEQEIMQFEQGLTGLEADMRMGRTRYPIDGKAVFKMWGPHLFKELTLDDIRGWKLGIGIDHGSRPGAQRAVLVAAGPLAYGSPFRRVHILDEYKGDGRTESEEDARGIISMLERNGLTLAHVDHWVGDRAHGGDHRGGAKSNELLRAAFAVALGLNIDRTGWTAKLPVPLQRMYTPRKSHRSHWEGFNIMHRMMLGENPPLSVSPRCVHLDEDVREWRGKTTDPHKDGLDGARYIIVPFATGKRR